MRVGLVTDFYYPWIGGPSTVVRSLGHGLSARGNSVALLAPSANGPPALEDDGPVAVTRVPTLPVPFGYKLRMAGWTAGRVGAWMDAFRPDVVHIHHPFPLSAQALFQARKRGIPVAATNHTIPECSLWGIRRLGPIYGAARAGFGRWIVGLLARCDAVATPTGTAARALHDLGYRGRVVAISNGVDTSRFSPGPEPVELRRRLGLDERPIILYTGRLDAEKEMHVWLRAAAECARDVDAQFLIGGEGNERRRLELLAASLGITDRVRFMGYLSDADHGLVYRLADAYCIMSPVELQSIATLEAVATGLPVVAARAGALPELVRDGYNGYLVEPGDWRAVAAALRLLLGDATKRDEMGKNCLAVGLQHTMDETVRRYEEFLHSAIERAYAATPGGPGRERAATARD